MCYPCGSVDLSVKLCPMCKVFPHTRCPHKREICRNRAVHPRFDVMFLKNAEVESFNGCGWCKWANFLQYKIPLAHNQGWPGCCRAPQPSEFRFISVVDWKAVSTVHSIPIPPDVKIMLDTISAASPSSRRSTPPPAKNSSSALSPTTARHSPPPKPPTFNHAISASKEKPCVAVSIPGKSKASPKQSVAPLGSVRSTASSASSSSPKSASGIEIQSHRHRHALPEFGEVTREKERKGDATAKSSPPNTSKNVEGEIAAPSPKRLSQSRRNSSASSNMSTSSKPVDKVQDGSVRRRSPLSPNAPSPAARSVVSNASPGRASAQRQSSPINAEPKKEADSRSSSGSSDSHSSGGSGSVSDSTVTSDGGFTDYLSEESEAELQRQAEARAALQAQNQIEEMEFKAVRQRLAHVDLRPPKSWTAAGLRMGIAASSSKI